MQTSFAGPLGAPVQFSHMHFAGRTGYCERCQAQPDVGGLQADQDERKHGARSAYLHGCERVQVRSAARAWRTIGASSSLARPAGRRARSQDARLGVAQREVVRDVVARAAAGHRVGPRSLGVVVQDAARVVRGEAPRADHPPHGLDACTASRVMDALQSLRQGTPAAAQQQHAIHARSAPSPGAQDGCIRVSRRGVPATLQRGPRREA
jgi:hypothetical protein